MCWHVLSVMVYSNSFTNIMKRNFAAANRILRTGLCTTVEINAPRLSPSVNLIIFLTFYLIYLLTAIGLTLVGSSTVHIYTQTLHRTTQ